MFTTRNPFARSQYANNPHPQSHIRQRAHTMQPVAKRMLSKTTPAPANLGSKSRSRAKTTGGSKPIASRHRTISADGIASRDVTNDAPERQQPLPVTPLNLNDKFVAAAIDKSLEWQQLHDALKHIPSSDTMHCFDVGAYIARRAENKQLQEQEKQKAIEIQLQNESKQTFTMKLFIHYKAIFQKRRSAGQQQYMCDWKIVRNLCRLQDIGWEIGLVFDTNVIAPPSDIISTALFTLNSQLKLPLEKPLSTAHIYHKIKNEKNIRGSFLFMHSDRTLFHGLKCIHQQCGIFNAFAWLKSHPIFSAARKQPRVVVKSTERWAGALAITKTKDIRSIPISFGRAALWTSKQQQDFKRRAQAAGHGTMPFSC